MKKTSHLLAATAIAVLAMLALVAPAGAQTGAAPGSGASGGVAGVTTVPVADPQVQGATAVAPAGALPYTGNDSLPMVQIGVALLVAGGLVTFAVRKRNAAARA